jgi:hypothetical protein
VSIDIGLPQSVTRTAARTDGAQAQMPGVIDVLVEMEPLSTCSVL